MNLTAPKTNMLKKGLLPVLVLTIVLIIVIVGTPPSSKNKSEVTNLVNLYEKNYIAFLKDQDLSKIRPYTTEKQLKKVEVYTNYYMEKRQIREINDLVNLKIVKSEISTESAVVNTLEVWNVRFEDLKTKKVTDQGEGFYKNTYNLVHRNGQWLVDSVNLIEVLKK